MEFETKLLHAIFYFENGTSNSWLQHVFNSQQKWEEIRQWLVNYKRDGFTPDFWNRYDQYLKVFNDKTDYGGYVDPNFPKMSFIESLRSMCN